MLPDAQRRIEAHVAGQVAEETNGDGKKRYPNEESRRAETFKRLAFHEDYLATVRAGGCVFHRNRPRLHLMPARIVSDVDWIILGLPHRLPPSGCWSLYSVHRRRRVTLSSRSSSWTCFQSGSALPAG